MHVALHSPYNVPNTGLCAPQIDSVNPHRATLRKVIFIDEESETTKIKVIHTFSKGKSQEFKSRGPILGVLLTSH